VSPPYKGISTAKATPGIIGTNNVGGDGVLGESKDGNGVVGRSDEAGGVLGEGPTGVYGRNTLVDGNGVIGYSDRGRGVWGHSNQTGIGVLGESKDGQGVVGKSQTWQGVYGWSGTNAGVVGESDNGNGVWVRSHSPHEPGLFATNDKGGPAAVFAGNVVVTGDVILPNAADCAEEFDLVETATVDPGTVMVLDASGALAASERAYDKCVVGVISGAGAYRPGIVLDRRPHPVGNRQPLALVGKVFCKVDADFGAIAVGDLLTTSATPGHAMAALDSAKAFGAVIGKALQPLREGRGLIPILVALQ
jgi:hypothetical protein